MSAHNLCLPIVVISGSEPRTLKRTEQPRFLQAEKKLKIRCIDAGVQYESPDSDEDEDATHRRRSKLNMAIRRAQNDVRTNSALSSLCSANDFSLSFQTQLQQNDVRTKLILSLLCSANAFPLSFQSRPQPPTRTHYAFENTPESTGDDINKFRKKCSHIEGNDEEGYWQPICAVCDRVQIGSASFSSMSKKELLECETRLSVASYQEFYETTLNPELVLQYEVKGCEGLLLSTNSRPRPLEDDSLPESLPVCTSCKTSLLSNYRSPPKYTHRVLLFVVRPSLTNWGTHSACLRLQVGYCQRFCHRQGAEEDHSSEAERRNC